MIGLQKRPADSDAYLITVSWHAGAFTDSLLTSCYARERLDPYYGRRIPLANEDVLLRCVQAHGQTEGAFRRRQPVSFFVLSGAIVPECRSSDPSGLYLNGIQLLTAKRLRLLATW